MSITLLNFEAHFRDEKIIKSRDLFLKGHVVELQKAKVVWIGKLKIGMYKVQVNLQDIEVADAKCNCDNRSKSGYCEHKLAVLFALRKELNLYPALTSSTVKHPPGDDKLYKLLWEINYSDEDPTQKDIDKFTRTAKSMLAKAEKDIKSGNYRSALGNCFEVIKREPMMNVILQWDYQDGEALLEKAFDLLDKAQSSLSDEAILEDFAYDLRVQALSNYGSDFDLWQNWMKLLSRVSNDGLRLERYRKVLDTFEEIEKNFSIKDFETDRSKASLYKI